MTGKVHESRSALLLGFSLLALTHFLFLREAPAFHLDEAWAANFSHRIASEHGFWPIQAMVTYTSPWSHYVTALVFKFFGTNLFNYRATGIIEVIIGIGLISASLRMVGEKKSAYLLPLIVAFFPTLVMNHRWVFEENTFFLVCVGFITLGLALRWRDGPKLASSLLVVTGITLGVSSHVLFLGSALSLWVYLFLRGKIQTSRDRMTVALTAVLLLGFFLLILKTEPEKGKPLAVVALDLVILAASLIPSVAGIFKSERIRNRVLIGLTIGGLPLLVPFLVFGEGTWLDLFFSGKLETPLLIGTIFIPIALTLYWLPRKKIPLLSPLNLLPISLLFIQLMVVKPGPRYFEIPYLFSAVLFAMALARISSKQRGLVLGLWISLGALNLGVNYFKPALEQTQIARSYRFWIFHDASYDMLPKLRLVSRLAAEGCSYSDIDVPDDRLRQTLEFLSLGDWPPTHGECNLGRHVKILTSGVSDQPEISSPPSQKEGPYFLIGENVAPSISR